jgi:hypothetical protein
VDLRTGRLIHGGGHGCAVVEIRGGGVEDLGGRAELGCGGGVRGLSYN